MMPPARRPRPTPGTRAVIKGLEVMAGTVLTTAGALTTAGTTAGATAAAPSASTMFWRRAGRGWSRVDKSDGMLVRSRSGEERLR